MNHSDKRQIIERLVRNSIRHLERGLNSFASGDIDFAVIDCFFGVEILCKALVFDGHWKYIFQEPGDADIAKLKSGNCRTIGLDLAVKRLRVLLDRPLPPSVSHLNTLGKHRNKAAHFFHPGLTSGTEKATVARDLANAWSVIRELRLIQEYESVFSIHHAEFLALEGKLLILDGYLDEMAATIRLQHSDPDSLTACPACKRSTFDGQCAICGFHTPQHGDILDGEEYIPPASCPKCGGDETVMHAGANSRCTECGHAFSGIRVCEYCCDSFVTLSIDDHQDDLLGTYNHGCTNCTGYFGAISSRDD